MFHRQNICFWRMFAMSSSHLPYFAEGTVIKGFGRGSKDLGIPTANFPEHVVDKLPEDIACGVYYGWANVDSGEVYKMVMSIGWNPFYKNTKKTMETHIMNVFKEDFYGSVLKTVMLGYIRPMTTFKSLDELITAIKSDIGTASDLLESKEAQDFKKNNFFKNTQKPS
ncbi:riboflavin kinase-like [Gigantopelta aegis]|uniref:riboflavin kinase-like n=1 Tax=Gigantopelta aegis TaxID=1735272 RepID=UPI001B88E4D7|nr:riboflavin kinase-like [Gigantopelta aegis]